MSEPRLKRVASLVRSLPEKKKRAGLAGRIAQYSGKVGTASTRLRQIVGAEASARAVFPDFKVDGAAEPVRRARKIAGDLKIKVLSRVEVLEDAKTDEQVTRLQEHALKAEKLIQERWAKLIKERIDTFEPLVRAATDAKLVTDYRLQTALASLRGYQDAPPTTSAEVKLVHGALETLTGSVKTLGIEGPVRSFLEAASRGEGNPRALLDPEVTAFVERYNLWRLLVVRFR